MISWSDMESHERVRRLTYILTNVNMNASTLSNLVLVGCYTATSARSRDQALLLLLLLPLFREPGHEASCWESSRSSCGLLLLLENHH